MNNFQIFININIIDRNFVFLLKKIYQSKPLFQNILKLDTTKNTELLVEKNFGTFLKNNILEVEKKYRISVDKINLMIENEKQNNIEITFKKNFENKNIDVTSIEYLFQDIRQKVTKNHPEKKIVHIIIKKCFVDDEEYNNIPFGKKCKNLVIQICFIYLKNQLVSKLELLLQEHQIQINKVICSKYAKSLLSADHDDLSNAGMAILNDNNFNEIGIYSKKITKMGFFEKLFHILS